MAESQRKVTLFVFDASDRPIELRYDNDNFNAVAIRRGLDAFLMPVASFILEMSVLKTGNTIIITSSTDAGKRPLISRLRKGLRSSFKRLSVSKICTSPEKSRALSGLVVFYDKCFFRYFPVIDFGLFATSSGVPLATSLPPFTPPSGPRSIR